MRSIPEGIRTTGDCKLPLHRGAFGAVRSALQSASEFFVGAGFIPARLLTAPACGWF